MTDLEQAALTLLSDCPLGFNEGQVIIDRATEERDVVAWLANVYNLRDRLRAEHAFGKAP